MKLLRLPHAIALVCLALSLACNEDTFETPTPPDNEDMATADMAVDLADMAGISDDVDVPDLAEEDSGGDMSCAPDCIIACDYLDETDGVCGEAMTDVDGSCQAPVAYEDVESVCDDGLDNDCDGEVDCGGDCESCDIGDVRWATAIPTAGIASGRAVVATNDGVIVGFRYVNDDVDLGDGPLPHAGALDAGLAKFDTSGNHVFSLGMGGPGSDSLLDVAVDSSGDIYITGRFEGTSSFGGSALTAAGEDIFIAKFDSNGTHLWSKNVGGTANDVARNIKVTSNDEIVIAGALGNAVDLGGGAIGASDGSVFVAHYDADGNHLFSKAWAATGNFENAFGLALDAADNIYLTGYFVDDIDFGGGVLNAPVEGAFLVKLDSSANHIWSTSIGDANGWGEGNDVVVTPSGESYFSIYFRGTIEAAGNTFTYAEGETGFLLVKLDSDGNALWSSTDGGRDLAIDGEGNVFVVDSFTDTVTLGGETLTAVDGRDAYIAKVSPDGIPLWTSTAGGQDNDDAYGVAATPTGVSYITGGFSETLDDGSGMITSDGITNGFVLSLTR